MRHWLQLATRNWRVKPGRAIASIAAIALGVGTVVSVTCFYESVRRAITDQVVTNWLGNSHLTIEPPLGHWGHIKQNLVGPLSRVDNVAHVTCRLKRAMTVMLSRPGAALWSAGVDATGIDPSTEYDFREYRGVVGRLPRPGERGVAVVETKSARDWGLGIGDAVSLAVSEVGAAREFTIIGTYEVRRVASFQRPSILLPLEDVQEIKNEPGQVTSIDLMLQDASVQGLKRTAEKVRAVVNEWNQRLNTNWQVSTAETRLQQLQEAEQVTQLVLTLVAFVALLTSFFIILTTMSMGIIERISVLGMMRCVGITRSQLAALVLTEVVPMGAVGILLGVPIGLGLTKLGALLVPEYVEGVSISVWGMWLATVGGGLTVLAAAGLLVVLVCRISPLAAANPEAKPARTFLAVIAAVLGLAMLVAHQWMIRSVEAHEWFDPLVAFSGVASIYLGYVLAAPAIVLIAGTGAIHFVSAALRMRPKLARDQIGRSPWRSAAICWMLMVGLSLIVYIAVRSESVIAAWDFPSKLPATFVWSPDRVSFDVMDDVRQVPGVIDATAVGEIACRTGPPDAEATSFLEGLKEKFRQPVPSTFVAGELDTFLEMTKLGFLQGDLESTIEKLRRGGYVLLPPESARTYGLGVGDKITLSVGQRSAQFEVAGVVESPALDIAVSFFQADSYMMLAAAGSFLGTLEDADRCFGVNTVTMFMMNVDLPSSRPPPEFKEDDPPHTDHATLAASMLDWERRLPNQQDVLAPVGPRLRAFVDGETPVLDDEARELVIRFALAVNDIAPQWADYKPQERWDLYRERLVLRRVAHVMDRTNVQIGSLRTLKDSIDREIREATLLMSAIPAIALIVAALGVANLMMVNVNTRSRQIAVLRAVGATKSQIVRLVLAEALALGTLGSAMGVTLGLHSAASVNTLSAKLLGFETASVVPWGQVAAAVLLTLVICLAAGIGPARHAARNNIVDAMSAT